MRLGAENLGGERGGETVFSGVDFSLAGGEALAVTGPNGAGKSTLLRVVAGLLPATSGRIDFAGNEKFPDLADALHYLGHANALKPALTVDENLAFWQRLAGRPHLDVGEALTAVGLEDVRHLPFGYLSTGQKRRVAIARLLASYRPVWLLDEPTAGLDKASQARFAEVTRTHLDEGGIVVAATHMPLGLEGVGELKMEAHP